jgi:UDP-hydrolysing UDP-N-acetyl-D-glucosamine 2-epimerase
MINNKKNVHNVGCTSFDEIKKLDLNDIDFFEKFKTSHGVGADIKLKKKNYIIFALHPVTTDYSKNEKNINECLYALSNIKMPIIFLWPNIDAGSDLISKGIRKFRENNTNKNIFFVKSISIEYFAPLLKNCSCIVGNSSTGLRESSFLGIPSVNLGDRQKNRERASNVVDIDFDRKKIIKAVNLQIQKKYKSNFLYGSGNSSEKILKYLLKYFENEKA